MPNLGPRCLAHLVLRNLAHRIARPRSERGAAALEFGLVFPVVLLVIFGIIQYGYHFWSLHTAKATARETARMLIVGSDWGCAQEHAVQHASAPAVGSTPPVVSREYHSEDGTAQAAPVVGSMVTVTVSFDSLDIGLPFLPVPNNAHVTQAETARIENVPPQRLRCDSSQDYVAGVGSY